MLADEIEIVLDLPVDRRIETVVVEFQVTAPTIEIFRIIVKRDRGLVLFPGFIMATDDMEDPAEIVSAVVAIGVVTYSQ